MQKAVGVLFVKVYLNQINSNYFDPAFQRDQKQDLASNVFFNED